jgi:hypothetical protein
VRVQRIGPLEIGFAPAQSREHLSLRGPSSLALSRSRQRFGAPLLRTLGAVLRGLTAALDGDPTFTNPSYSARVCWLTRRSDERGFAGALFHRDFGSAVVGVEVCGTSGGGDCPGGHGPAGRRLRATPRNNSPSGHAAAKAMRTRVAVSVTRPAILSSRMRTW